MSFNYECDFTLQSGRLTPITKRQDVRLGILESISSAIQWNRDNFFDSYIEGDSAAAWVSGFYLRYERVNYQNRIYECTNDNTGELPTNTDYWVLTTNDFRGARERIKYNSQKLMLEYMLNRWFGTTFNQPSTLTNSDFYIVNNTRFVPGFSVPAATFREGIYVSSAVFEQSRNSRRFVKSSPAYNSTSNFSVYYPLAIISSPTDSKFYQMSGLIDKYKVIGSTAEYISY